MSRRRRSSRLRQKTPVTTTAMIGAMMMSASAATAGVRMPGGRRASVVVVVALTTAPRPPALFRRLGRGGLRASPSSSSSSSSWGEPLLPPRRLAATRTSLSSSPSRDDDNGDARVAADDTPRRLHRPLLEGRKMTLRSNSKLSLAPMMEYTDRHFRHLVRLISDRTLVYTEMVAANAVAHDAFAQPFDERSDPSHVVRLLGQGRRREGPSVLQLGGSDPDQMFVAARAVRELNLLQRRREADDGDFSTVGDVRCDYTAMNLNCGCPSPKVAGKGCFGAALMSDPRLVRRLTTSMFEGCDGTMPVSVKCRIGTDANYGFTRDGYALRDMEDEYRELRDFVEEVASGGVVTDFQVHARIAVLSRDYSPADNRKVPPLRYDHVRRLATEFPNLNVSLNGGIDTLSGVRRELETCDRLEGIMVGRGYVADPWSFATADELLYPPDNDEDDRDRASSTRVGGPGRPRNRMDVLEAYGAHADHEERRWGSRRVRRYVLRAITNLFAGEHNARRYRIALDEIVGSIRGITEEDVVAPGPPLSELIVRAASVHLSEEVLYRTPEESYEKSLFDEERAERKRNNVATTVILGGGADNDDEFEHSSSRRSSVREWQASRKEDEMNDQAMRSHESGGGAISSDTP
ncbi:hypothetical protein ACHAW5_003052 [Stephanodiscus triporus]|uniref:DUS-like FMN-binding domain-containing protein n=1 Tax=Stephanodiscus triporus TaxID=2934178 RepID=A0ABD3NP52_9STRA